MNLKFYAEIHLHSFVYYTICPLSSLFHIKMYINIVDIIPNVSVHVDVSGNI